MKVREILDRLARRRILASRDQDGKRDTGKLMTACRALTADVLCLATSQPAWSARTRATVQAACEQADIRTLGLEGLGAAPGK